MKSLSYTVEFSRLLLVGLVITASPAFALAAAETSRLPLADQRIAGAVLDEGDKPVAGGSTVPITITGTVVDEQGKPAPNVLVMPFPFVQEDAGTTDANGRFTFAENPFIGLVRDQRILVARDFAHNLAAVQYLEDSTSTVSLRLLPGLTLAGRASDLHGQAVSNAQARVWFRMIGASMTFGSPVGADADGRFEIKALPMGRRYGVVVSAAGFGQERRTVEAPEGNTQRVELDAFALLAADQQIAGVVLGTDERPAVGAFVNVSGEKQPDARMQTDGQGRFAFNGLCAGSIRLSANAPDGRQLFGQATVKAGDTNITLQLARPRVGGGGPREVFQPVSLKGKPLPDLTSIGLRAAEAPSGQPVLAVFVDTKRSLVRFLESLGQKAGMLKEKGVAVIVVQSSPMSEDLFATWKQQADLPFPTGWMKDNVEKTRAAWGVGSLPWLLLTDRTHRVIDEGFSLAELDSKLPAATK